MHIFWHPLLLSITVFPLYAYIIYNTLYSNWIKHSSRVTASLYTPYLYIFFGVTQSDLLKRPFSRKCYFICRFFLFLFWAPSFEPFATSTHITQHGTRASHLWLEIVFSPHLLHSSDLCTSSFVNVSFGSSLARWLLWGLENKGAFRVNEMYMRGKWSMMHAHGKHKLEVCFRIPATSSYGSFRNRSRSSGSSGRFFILLIRLFQKPFMNGPNKKIFAPSLKAWWIWNVDSTLLWLTPDLNHILGS